MVSEMEASLLVPSNGCKPVSNNRTHSVDVIHLINHALTQVLMVEQHPILGR